MARRYKLLVAVYYGWFITQYLIYFWRALG